MNNGTLEATREPRAPIIPISKLVLGIDPDSKAHGVAVYINGELVQLKCMTLFEIFGGFMRSDNVEIHIEDVKSQKGAWHGVNENKKSVGMIGQNIGKCKQAQIELERFAEEMEIKVVHHKVSSMWKSQASKKQFERATGWKERSNEDTRSAAYFGWLGTQR